MKQAIERVLVAPLNYSHVQNGQYQAFEEVFGKDNVLRHDFMGRYEVRRGHKGRSLLDDALDFAPDWIWLQVQNSEVITPGMIANIRDALPSCLITHWMGDCRPTVGDYLTTICQVTHGTLISSVGQIPLYRDAGAPRVAYCQIGLDHDEDVLGEPPWTPPFRVPEVVFCGGHYGHVEAFASGTAERLGAIRALIAAGFDVGVVGRGWPDDIPVAGECHVKQQMQLYRHAKVALAINHFNDIDRYYSDRLLIALASGTPVVARYVPNLGKEFDVGTELCQYTPQAGPRPFDPLIARVTKLLANPDLAKAIGDNGRKRVLAEHTWTARIRQILPRMNDWRWSLRSPL